MPPRKADALIPLQDLDLQIHKLKVQRAEKPRQLASAEKKVSHAKDNLAAVQAEIKALKLESSKRELTVKEFDVKIEKTQTQSMTAKKNEEYQAFQKEISGMKADKSRVEDGLLDLMMQLEEKAKLEKLQMQSMTAKKNDEYQAFQKEISGIKADKLRVEDGLLDLMMQSEEKGKLEKLRQEEVKTAEDEYAVAKKKLEAEMAVDDREIESQLAKRGSIAAACDKEMIRVYERVLANKDDGVALAGVSKYETIEDEGKVVYWQLRQNCRSRPIMSRFTSCMLRPTPQASHCQ